MNEKSLKVGIIQAITKTFALAEMLDFKIVEISAKSKVSSVIVKGYFVEHPGLQITQLQRFEIEWR